MCLHVIVLGAQRALFSRKTCPFQAQEIFLYYFLKIFFISFSLVFLSRMPTSIIIFLGLMF